MISGFSTSSLPAAFTETLRDIAVTVLSGGHRDTCDKALAYGRCSTRSSQEEAAFPDEETEAQRGLSHCKHDLAAVMPQ